MRFFQMLYAMCKIAHSQVAIPRIALQFGVR
jgi:hypothetical protein